MAQGRYWRSVEGSNGAEYVNYFHVQLQHFGHWPDLRLLLTGPGFRQAHLARDIAGLQQQVRRDR